MLTLIHGDDIASSRKFLNSIREKYPDMLTLDGETITLTDLMQELDGGGLFGDTKQILIENLISKRKTTSDFESLVSIINTSDTTEVYLWEGKEVDVKTVGLFSKPLQKVFKIPQTLFLFLDSLRPGNGKQLIELFHKTAEIADIEMIFFMLLRQVRSLIALASQAQIDETKRMAPWQRGKLEKQAKLFTKSQLVTIYKQLYTIEIGIKTGNLTNSLQNSIDIVLLSI
jgi:hypothetical protein